MINILKLAKEDIGRKVLYKSTEEGYITSYNDLYVFVRFGSDANGKAVNPRDLEFMWPNETIYNK